MLKSSSFWSEGAHWQLNGERVGFGKMICERSRVPDSRVYFRFPSGNASWRLSNVAMREGGVPLWGYCPLQNLLFFILFRKCRDWRSSNAQPLFPISDQPTPTCFRRAYKNQLSLMKTWTSERLVTKLTHPPSLTLISSLIASLICPAHQFPVTQFIFRPMIQIKYFYWTTWPNEQKHCKFPGNVPNAGRQSSTAGVSFLPWHQMFLTVYVCTLICTQDILWVLRQIFQPGKSQHYQIFQTTFFTWIRSRDYYRDSRWYFGGKFSLKMGDQQIWRWWYVTPARCSSNLNKSTWRYRRMNWSVLLPLRHFSWWYIWIFNYCPMSDWLADEAHTAMGWLP